MKLTNFFLAQGAGALTLLIIVKLGEYLWLFIK